jgi:endonuclease/exonuclease/phosphatase family metal-dependent hydrolase
MREESTLRLVTWNAWWRFGDDWRGREAGIIAVLRALDPDVVGLQECWGEPGLSQAEVLAEALRAEAAFVEVGLPPAPDPVEHDDQEGVAMGLGFVSRWPIADVIREPMPSEGRDLAALRGTIAHPRGMMQVVVGATSWEPDRLEETSRQVSELERLVELGDGPLPSFLLADLNYDYELPAMRELHLQDGWAAAPTDADPRTLSSQNRFAPPEAVNQYDRRIDHVLFTPGAAEATAVSADIVRDEPYGSPPSDHYPVVVDVRF